MTPRYHTTFLEWFLLCALVGALVCLGVGSILALCGVVLTPIVWPTFVLGIFLSVKWFLLGIFGGILGLTFFATIGAIVLGILLLMGIVKK